MKLSRQFNKVPMSQDSGAAIRLGEPAHIADENRAGLFLVVFMRLLSGLWLIQGLLQWSAILLPVEPLLDKMSTLRLAAVIFFAIYDLVAAVGLWLASPWGGVIWLLGAIAQIAAVLLLPGFFSILWAAAVVVLIVVYFILTWQAGRAGTPSGLFRGH